MEHEGDMCESPCDQSLTLPNRAEWPSPRGKRWYRGTLKGASRWNFFSNSGSRREADGSAGWNRLYTCWQAGRR